MALAGAGIKSHAFGPSVGGDSGAVIRYRLSVSYLQEAQMAKHEHGKMDISEQEKTFDGFIRWSVWVAAVSIGVLIFMALANS